LSQQYQYGHRIIKQKQEESLGMRLLWQVYPLFISLRNSWKWKSDDAGRLGIKYHVAWTEEEG